MMEIAQKVLPESRVFDKYPPFLTLLSHVILRRDNLKYIICGTRQIVDFTNFKMA